MVSWLCKDNYKNRGYQFNPFKKNNFDEFIKIFPLDNKLVAFLQNQTSDIIQFIGESGYGKSSLLFQIYYYFTGKNESVVYYHIPGNGDFFDISKFSPSVLLLDEVNLIKKDILKELTPILSKAKVLLILGTHIDLRQWIPSYIPVDTFHLSEIMPERISRILNFSLEFAAIDKPTNRFSGEAVKALEIISQGRMETVRSICYDIFLKKELPDIIDRDLVKSVAGKIQLTGIYHSPPGNTGGPDSLSR